MPQEDLLKRQIDLLGRVLGKIFFNSLGFKTSGDISDKLESIQKQIKSELDLDLDELLDKPFDEFVKLVQNEKRWNEENLTKYADILLEMCNIIDDQKKHQERKVKLLNFALKIYEYINSTSLIYSYDRNSKMEKIKTLLKLS